MLQYIPGNWPFDNSCRADQGNKQVNYSKTAKDNSPSSVFLLNGVSAGFYLLIIEPKDMSKQQVGCFKSRQMAYFGKQIMSNSA